MADDNAAQSAGRHRPKTTTVFVAAFVAGAVAAVVVNRALDVHLAQSKPQVESEPIFVALRAMPQGSPVTVWDVALRDWPRAMLPSSALRAGDSFEGSVLKYPVREGQPLLAVQLMPAERPTEQAPAAVEEAFVPPPPAAAPTRLAAIAPQSAPVETVATVPATIPAPQPEATQKIKAAAPVPTTPVATASPAVVEKPAAPETVATTPPAADDKAIAPSAPESPADTATAAEKTIPAPSESRKPFELEPIDVASGDASKDDQPETEQPKAPTLAPPAKQEPTLVESDVEPLLETPSRPAVDLEKIPSVMARSEKAAQPAEPSVSNNPVRYLVVPERIARQADTSFVPPPAVEPTPEPTAAPKAPPAANPTRSAQTSTPPVKGFPQRPGMPTTASRPRSKQTAPRTLPQVPPQTQTRQQKQPQKKPPTPAQAQAKQTSQQRQPQQGQQGKQSPERTRPETASKTREPMFPVLAAGLEAMGSRWRSGGDQEATATDQPNTPRRK